VTALTANTGCGGIPYSFAINGQTFSGHILAACDPPMSTIAGISRVLVGVGVSLAGGFALLRLAGAGFGFNVSPGGGGNGD
jgi:hypothetical protein